MMFAKLMASPGGRVIRIVAGIALIGGGVLLQSPIGYGLAVVGVIPLAAGLLDFCLLAPLLGCPIAGRDIRDAK